MHMDLKHVQSVAIKEAAKVKEESVGSGIDVQGFLMI